MTKDEALRLALDWFKCYQDKSMSRNNAEELADEVIVAIKAALEAKDEPVATKNNDGVTLHLGWDDLPVGTKLYTIPPKRTWVGLTDQVKQEWIDAMPSPPQSRHFMVLVNAIESELKELNT